MSVERLFCYFMISASWNIAKKKDVKKNALCAKDENFKDAVEEPNHLVWFTTWEYYKTGYLNSQIIENTIAIYSNYLLRWKEECACHLEGLHCGYDKKTWGFAALELSTATPFAFVTKWNVGSFCIYFDGVQDAQYSVRPMLLSINGQSPRPIITTRGPDVSLCVGTSYWILFQACVLS